MKIPGIAPYLFPYFYFFLLQLYPTYSRSSPFLVEQFQEYFLGGLDDMAFWSTNIYSLTSFMLENGTR